MRIESDTRDFKIYFEKLIREAFSSKSDCLFSYSHRYEQCETLIKVIKSRKEKVKKGTDGILRLDMQVSEIIEEPEIFLADIDAFISTSKKDKYLHTLRFMTVVNYINRVYESNINVEKLRRKYFYKDGDRRRIEILKRMQCEFKGIKQSEMAEALGIDEKTIREDFRILESGFNFLDNEVSIAGRDMSNIYNSPAHPIFLIMNTTQLYACLYALTQLTGQSILDETCQTIARAICTQLTDTAKALVEELSPESTSMEDGIFKFTNTLDLMKMNNTIKLLHEIAYKKKCTISYKSDFETKEITGVPTLQKPNKLYLVSMADETGNTITINYNDIVSIRGER
ncbi:MAG: hypothetical protein EOM59_09250 [Clostridia bacterium]|nr:hypothetical protein [Clostridia bacterium]